MISRNRFPFHGFGFYHKKPNSASEYDSVIGRKKQEYFSDKEEIPCKCEADFEKKTRPKVEPHIFHYTNSSYDELTREVMDAQDRKAEQPIALNVEYNEHAEEGEKFSLTACKKSNKRKFDEFCMKTSLPKIDSLRLDISQTHIKWYHTDFMDMINVHDVETVDGVPVTFNFQKLVKNANGLDELVPLDFQGVVRQFTDAQGKINKLIYLHSFYSLYISADNKKDVASYDEEAIQGRLLELHKSLCNNSHHFFEDKYGTVDIMPQTDDQSPTYIFRLRTCYGVKARKCHKEFLFRVNEGSEFQGIMSAGDIKKHLIGQVRNVDCFNNDRKFYGDLYSHSDDLDSKHEDLNYTHYDNEQQTRLSLPNLLHNDIIED